jgi:hypothetical protein
VTNCPTSTLPKPRILFTDDVAELEQVASDAKTPHWVALGILRSLSPSVPCDKAESYWKSDFGYPLRAVCVSSYLVTVCVSSVGTAMSIREVITANATRHASGSTEMDTRDERPMRSPPSLRPVSPFDRRVWRIGGFLWPDLRLSMKCMDIRAPASPNE